jgi:16S rRNA (guanine527-N7)-methyltransferase
LCRRVGRQLDVRPVLSYYVVMTDTFLPLDVLESGARELGISLTQEQLGMFDMLARVLVEANNQVNLTRILDPTDIVQLHYLDSLTCLAAYKPKNQNGAIDVGTGAGFPGLVIKIAEPELPMVLVDATGKKVRFVEEVINKLGIVGAAAKCARAEELGRLQDFRGSFGTVYARALAVLPVVAELCIPLLKIGGMLVAQKAGDITEEIKSAEQIIDALGGRISEIIDMTIPGTDIKRKIILIRKIHPTSYKFPRTYPEIIGLKKNVGTRTR